MIVFDIIVPTFNRYNELPQFFKQNAALAGLSSALIWIVDDGSSQFDPAVIPSWPNLKVLRQNFNTGQAAARNVAIRQGQAPYIISLDDDAWFEDGHMALRLTENFFTNSPETGCLMFNVATPGSPYSRLEDGILLPLHVTCGCAYRRTTLESIGGFSGFMHSGAEETDISLRIYRDGWDIRFLANAKVFHNFQPAERPDNWLYGVRYNTTRNDLLIVLMYYPWFSIPIFILGKFLSHLRFAFRTIKPWQTFWHTAKAFGGFARLSGHALKNRKALTWRQLSTWRKILKQYAH